MLKLLKGDDTGGTFGRRLQFTITIAPGISTQGCYAEFIFDGITKTFQGPLVSGESREIFYSHNETAQMALGTRFATFRIIDSAGKIRTLDNTVQVKVTDVVGEIYPGSSTASVVIGASISWNDISGKPNMVLTINSNPPDASGNINVTAELPTCSITNLPEEFTENQMRNKINEMLGWMRQEVNAALAALLSFACVFTANAALTLDVTTKAKGEIHNTSNVVVGVALSGTPDLPPNYSVVSNAAMSAAPQSNTYTRAETDARIAAATPADYANVSNKAMRARQYFDISYTNVTTKFTWGTDGSSAELSVPIAAANTYDAAHGVNDGFVQFNNGVWTANDDVVPFEITTSHGTTYRYFFGEPNSVEYLTNGAVRIGLCYVSPFVPSGPYVTNTFYGIARIDDHLALRSEVDAAIASASAPNYLAVSNAAMRAFPSQGEMETGSIVWDGDDIKITTANGTTVNGFLTADNLTISSDCHLNGMTYFDDDTSFKIGDEYFGDWIKSGVWNTAEDPFAKRSEIPSPYTDAMASNVVTNVVTKSYVENLGISSAGYENYVWSYPNCWFIDVTMSNRVDVSVIPSETVVGYMVFSNDVEATTSGTDARCRAVLCDESSIETPSIKEWKSFTTGGSITSNGVFSADADGLYRVSAEDAVGKIRYVDIPIQSDVTTYATNTYYATDVAGTVRASVNSAALTLLQNATVVSTNWYEGTEYKVYSSFTPRMSAVGTGAGNVKCWAVSQHILSSAKHYAVKQLGANTFSDGVNSATVYRQEWVSLSDWAATNGFTAAEIAEAGIDDICLIRCAKSSAVPDGCIPYFMRSDKIDTWFGGTLAGVQAWMSVQDHTEAIPTTYKWEGDYTLKDVKAQYCRMGTLYPVHSGDSGRCIFMMKDGNPIMLSQFGTAYEGPSFVNGFKIIKAFVENYGDTIKEAN